MCEESACLVPPENASNGSADGRCNNLSIGDSNGSANCRDGEALVGFHEDALSQANAGKAQFMLTLVLGLALAAECSEFTIVGYILPAAELQLCIDEHRKGWLVSITLLALAIGSIGWGILGDRVGRRRALLSALSVTALFSAVATVMPTYGTFMTARFCSGMAIAGAMPLAFSYLAETCPRATRTRYMGMLHAFWPLGALLAATLAHCILPTDGAEIVQDNKEHWSSWHKFLILNITPLVASIIGLIWASESPRYLLEASREVEALEVYQRLHRLNKSHTQYGLTELELPGRSAYRERINNTPTTNIFSNGLESIIDSYRRLSTPAHLRTTLLLASLHLLTGLVYTGVATLSTSLVKDLNDLAYTAHTRTLHHRNYTDVTFNASQPSVVIVLPVGRRQGQPVTMSPLENVRYSDCVFSRVRFRHVELKHVRFERCVFDTVEFSNVKSSVTYFENCTIVNSRFVDTDLSSKRFLNSDLLNNTFISLIPDCAVDFDYNIYLDDLYTETVSWAAPMLPALLLLGLLLETVSRPPVLVTVYLVASTAAICIIAMYNFTVLLLVAAVIRVVLVCGVNVLTVVLIEEYPCHLRCTAHGLMRSLFHIASLCAIPIYSILMHSVGALLFPAALTVTLTFTAAVLSYSVQDNSNVLL